MIFKPDLGRNFWDILPQIFLTFKVTLIFFVCFIDNSFLHFVCYFFTN